ncbi:MAG: hypothetical protein V2B18_01445 [Pseudomonadota bacterium]
MKPFEDTSILPPFLATAVGSMPHTDSRQAVDLILSNLIRAPHVPQLPMVDPREQMWIQYSEGLPAFKVDLENLKYYFDTEADGTAEAERFYTDFLAVDDGAAADSFAIGPDYARGCAVLRERLRSCGEKPDFVKVQVTGPLSFALTVTDEVGKPIFYHPVFRDIAVKGMGLKAAWLVEQFKPLAKSVIVFFDEPILSAFGSSAFLGVSRTDVVDSLNEVISMAVRAGGIPGVHCCGNTDWGILMETETRIINFDAVDYMHTVALYPEGLNRFLAGGGVLAWGAVPNTERIMSETMDDVLGRIQEGVRLLTGAGVNGDLLKDKIIVTPACGCAGLTMEHTERVYEILAELGARVSHLDV